MPDVTYSEAAIADLSEIWDFVAEDSIFQADQLLRRFQAKLEFLATCNTIGRPRTDLSPNCRSYPIGKFCIYYRPTPDGIELIRLLHSARDIRRIKFSGKM